MTSPSWSESAFGIIHKAKYYEAGVSISSKKATKLFKHTKTVHAARAEGSQRHDMSVHDDDGGFFRKPKRIIASQPAWEGAPNEGIKYVVHGGGARKGRVAGAAAAGTGLAGTGYAVNRKKQRSD